jgi:hypothetical protein
MRDRDDEHVIGLNGEEHCVWEDMNKTSPHILFEDTPTRRSLGNATKR